MNLTDLNLDFANSSWFNSYKLLIKNNQSTEDYSEKHHIIPRCYFKYYNLPIDNSKNNIIQLSYFNHVLAHYYLYKACSNFQLKCKLAKALLLTMNKLDIKSNNFNAIDAFLDTNLVPILNELPKIKIAANKENKKNLLNIWQKPDIRAKILSTWTTERRQYIGKVLGDWNRENLCKEVICIETGIIYKSILEAAKTLSVKNHISMCCKNPNRTCGGYHWAYANDKKMIEILSKFENKPKKNSTPKKIYCIELDKIFESGEAASRATGVRSCHIRECCRGLLKSAGKLHWRYINESR